MASKRKSSHSEFRPEKKSLTGLPSDVLGLISENIGVITPTPLSSFIQDKKLYTIEKKLFDKELPDLLLYDSQLWVVQEYYLSGFLSLLKAGKYDVDTFTKLFAKFMELLVGIGNINYWDTLIDFDKILTEANYNNWFTENMQGLANFLINVYKLTNDYNIFLILTGDVGGDLWHHYSQKTSFGRGILDLIDSGEIKYDPIYQKIFNDLENYNGPDEEEEKDISGEFDNLKIENKIIPNFKKDDGKCVMLTEEELLTYTGMAYSTEDSCNNAKDLDEKEKKELLIIGYQKIMEGAILSYNFELMNGILKYIAPFYDLTFKPILNELTLEQMNYLVDILKMGEKDSVAYKMVDDVRDELMAKYHE